MKVASIAVFNHDGKLLFGKRSDSQRWTLPGGKAEDGESPEQTAVRELFEETGLRADSMGYIGCGQPYPSLTVYAFKAIVGDVKPTGSHDPDKEVDYWDWRWVDITDGLPAKILENLHAPKNVTLGLLGLMGRQPEPEGAEPEESEDRELDDEVELSKSEDGIQLTEVLRAHDDLLPPAFRGVHLVAETRGDARVIRLLKGSASVAELRGRLGDEHAYLEAQRVDSGWQGRGVPILLRQAFVRLVKAEPPAEPTPELQRLWAAFWGPVGGRPDLQALKTATTIPDRVWAEALKPKAMEKNPQAVATLLARPDVDTEYLGRAADSVANVERGSWTSQARETVASALAAHPRLPSKAAASVGNTLILVGGGSPKAESSLAKLLARPDLDHDDYARLVTNSHDGFPGLRQTMNEQMQESPGRAAAVRDRLMGRFSGSGLKNFPGLRFSPEQVKAFFDPHTAAVDKPEAAQLHVFHNQPQDIPTETLNRLWPTHADNHGFEWTPEHVRRLDPEMLAQSLPDVPSTSYRSNAGIQHPAFSEAQVKSIIAAQQQRQPGSELPRDALRAPNISPEYRRELWNRMPAYSRKEMLATATPDLVEDFLNTAEAKDIKDTVPNLKARKDLGPDFWARQLQGGTNYSQAAQLYPELATVHAHLPNPVAAAVLPYLTHTGAVHMRNSLDWGNASEDLVRGMHAAQQRTKKGFEAATSIDPKLGLSSKSSEGYNARLQELGLQEPQRLKVTPGMTKLRSLRAAVEARGGTINDKELKAQGINLGSQGMGRLLDARGNLTTAAIDAHGTAMPSSDWTFSHSTWSGSQCHSGARQKVFQLNIGPERRRELDAMGLGDTHDALLQGGHPAAARHGAGWVRYTETPGGVHIDEIQTDIGHNTLQQLKQHPERARRLGADPEKVGKLGDFIWGGKNPSEVIHEAFLQHLRDAGKVGSEVHIWQLKPKMKLANQDPKKEAPAHMKETYDQQPKKMGYEPDQYGGLRAQGNSKLKGKPTWAQTLKREDDGWDHTRANLALGRVDNHDMETLKPGVPVPADIQKWILHDLDWNAWAAPVAALMKRPDVPRELWQPRLEQILRTPGQHDFLDGILHDPDCVRLLAPEQAQRALDYQLQSGGLSGALLSVGKLSPETLVQVASRATTLTHIPSIMRNPALDKDGHARVWNTLDPEDQAQLVGRVKVSEDQLDDLLKQPLGPGATANALRGARLQGNVSDAAWRRWLAPGSPVHEKLLDDPRLLNAVPREVLANDHVAQQLLPVMRAWSAQEHDGNPVKNEDDDPSYWWNAVSDHTLKALGATDSLPSLQGIDSFDTRMHRLGLRKSPGVEVRTGVGKLRQLRDEIAKKGGSIVPRELGLNMSAQGLGHLVDKEGKLTSAALQQHIDSQVPRHYTWSESEWDGGQQHNRDPSKVFQLNMSPAALEEMHRQGLAGAYHGIRNPGHPQHQGHGVGWVRYTQGLDGIHIDEIQSDFGHKPLARIKQDEARGALQPGSITSDQYQRLHDLMWGGQHPSAILHEAFLQHLRDRGEATGDQGKEVHVWQAKPKAMLANQDPHKPLPAHMMETYDRQPKKMGYKPDTYGVLETQDGVYRPSDGHPQSLTGEPTWSHRLRKFDLDVQAWLADNGPMRLNKSIGKKLMGLAAATALHVMPTGLDDSHNVPHPPEQQRIKDVFGSAPMTGADQQSVAVAVAPRKWSAAGLDPDLHPIAHLESNFGANTNHKRNPTDWETAYGALGMKPQTAHFEYKKSKTLQALYPGLEQEDMFTHRFKADPVFYNAVGNSHFGWLKRQVGGDAEKAALAWRYGLGAVQRAPDLEALDSEGYAAKYAALKAKQTAHRIATQPGTARAAIGTILDKSDA